MRFLKYTIYLFISIIGLLPIVVQFGLPIYLEKYLEENFSVKASIEKIQFNVFNGKVGIEGVHIYGDNEQSLHLGRLAADIDLGLLFEGKVFVESVLLSSFKTQIKQSDSAWLIGGMLIPIPVAKNEVAPKPEESTAWPFGIGEIRIEYTGVDLELEQINSNFVIDSFDFDGATAWAPDAKSIFDLMLTVNGAALGFNGSVKPFSPTLDVKLAIDAADLMLAPLISKIENDLPYSDMQAKFNANLQVSYSQVQVDEINGKIEKHISLDGQLSVSEIALTDFANNIFIAEEKVQWNGEVAVIIPSGQDAEVTALSTLVFSPLRVERTDTGLLLAQLSSLELNNIQLSYFSKETSVKVDGVSLQQFRGLKNLALSTKELLFIETLSVKDIAYSGEELSIAKVNVTGLQANVVINREGRLQLIDEAQNKKNQKVISQNGNAEDQIELVSENEQGNKSALRSILVKEFAVNGESDIKFSDYSVSPFFETDINKISLKVVNINTGDPTSWADVKLNAAVDDYGKVDMQGKVQPFSELANANAELTIENLALVPLSSYTGKYADLFIKRGVLSSRVNINIIEDKLDVKNTISLNKLKLEPGKSELSKRWLDDLPMPLDLTLNVLRDKNDVIALDIPVEGLVSDPNFHLQDIYNTAMAKALKFAATYYLTQAVQPLGLVISAGKLVGKAMQPRFNPLVFEAGSADLSSVNKKHLKKIAKLYVDRPKLSLTVCGVSAEADWLVIRNELKDEIKEKEAAEGKQQASNGDKKESIKQELLLKLASLRGKQVKRYILSVSKLNAARILSCNAKVDTSKKAQPIVVLYL